MHILLPVSRRLEHPSVDVHRSKGLLPADRSTAHGIAVTSPLRTVLDIASMVEESELELAIEDALRRRLFSVGQLEWRASARSGKGFAGSRVIAGLISRHGSTISDSGWEVRLEQALVAAGLPRPTRQLPVDTVIGRLHVDLGYAGSPIVAFEYDSDRWHSGVHRRHADMERRNALRSAGCLLIEANAALLRDPTRLFAVVRPLVADASIPVRSP